MKNKITFTAITILLLLSSFSAKAALQDLGNWGGDVSKVAVSGNGNVIVGEVSDGNVYKYENSTLTNAGAGTLGNIFESNRNPISFDGTIVGKRANSIFVHQNGETTIIDEIEDINLGNPNALLSNVDFVFIASGGIATGRVSAADFSDGVGDAAFFKAFSNVNNTITCCNDGSDINAGGAPRQNAISQDGNVFVSSVISSFYSPFFNMNVGIEGAVKYDVNSSTLYKLGYVTDRDASSVATAISSDGEVAAGYAFNNITNNYHAFKDIDDLEGQMIDLGNLGGNNARATLISGDGSTVVGYSTLNGELQTHAFKHTDLGGIVDLGTLGGSESKALSVSNDGSVIVGYSKIASDAADVAFKYQDGLIVNLGTLGGTNSYATSVSSDGLVIVGYSQIAGDTAYHAFRMLNTSEEEEIISVNNTLSAISKGSAKLNSALNLSETLINYNLSQDATLFGANNMHFSSGVRFSSVDKSKETGASFKFAHRFSNYFRAGIFADYGFGDNLPNGFDSQNKSPATTLFATISQNEYDLGLSLSLAASYNSSDLKITRDALTNTEAGAGITNLVSKAALAKVGYGFKLGNRLKIQPYVGIRVSEVTRDGYIETIDADFPVTFAKVGKKSTTALVGINSEFILTQMINARFGGGLEKDLSASLDNTSGSIAYSDSFNLQSRSIEQNRYFLNGGVSYKISPLQEVSFDIYYSKQSLDASNAVTGYLNYAIGF